ncbi:MAG: hypothetical protein ACK56I_24880, partial [bacterium]
AQELALLPRVGPRHAAGGFHQAPAQLVVEVHQQAAVGEHLLEELQRLLGALAGRCGVVLGWLVRGQAASRRASLRRHRRGRCDPVASDVVGNGRQCPGEMDTAGRRHGVTAIPQSP